MTRARCGGDHVCDELVVSGARLRLQDAQAFIRVESCILAAVATVDEVGRAVIEQAVRIRLNFEVPNQPEALTLEDSQMAIEAGYIQFVEVTAQEQRVLGVFESG